MDFKLGDVVRFKTGEPVMVVVSEPKENDLPKTGKSVSMECSWYDPTNSQASFGGFLRSYFYDFEIEKVGK